MICESQLRTKWREFIELETKSSSQERSTKANVEKDSVSSLCDVYITKTYSLLLLITKNEYNFC